MSQRFWQWIYGVTVYWRHHPFSPLVRLSNHARAKGLGVKPGDFRKARGILPASDEPAEATIRRLRDAE